MPGSYIELDEVLRRYAYRILQQRVNWFRRWLMEEDDYICEIDWSYLTLDHKVVKFAPSQEDGVIMETNWGNVMSGSRWVGLWSCDFDNKADGKQSHTFRGSRDTTTWVDVELKQYYTVEKEPNVNINLPPSFTKVRAGRDNSLHVNKVKGQIFKELLTWEVNSQVEVVPGWKAHAELLAREESYNINFEIRTTIYNPRGVVPVSFKRKTDGKVIYLVNVYDYQDAFRLEADGGVIKEDERHFVEYMSQVTNRVVDPKQHQTDDNNEDNDEEEADDENTSSSSDSKKEKEKKTKEKFFPQIITQGTIDCLCWSDQKVDIKTSPLGQDNSSNNDTSSYSQNRNSAHFDRSVSVNSNRDSLVMNHNNSSYQKRALVS